ncbi:MAG: CrcB family protein [Acidimicrobiales bacterium]|nr:CrcB family protein [Acidimicrobiales bacterium]
MNFPDVVWVGLAGSTGALARFVVDREIDGRVRSLVPLGTVVINISGALLLGLLTGLVLFDHAPRMLTLVAGAGFCGGFTTFSTSSNEAVALLRQGDYRSAALHGGVTLAGALVGGAVGLALAWL